MFEKDFLLSIVAPLCNEEANIDEFYKEIVPILNKCTNKWEIIFINDGSTDDSLLKLIDLSNRDSKIKIINFSRNFGKEAALSAGLKYSLGDVVIPIDVDLQDPPELIVDMCEYWKKGYEIVNAKRKIRKGETFVKKAFASLFYKFINKFSDIKIPYNVGDYRLLDKKVVRALNNLEENNRFMKGLFSWVGFRTKDILFIRRPRNKGKTNFNFFKLLNFAVDGITSFSIAPLRFFLYFGSFVLFSSFIYSAYVFIETIIFGVVVPGYASIVILVLFFGGLNMFGIGVIGEYIARIYNETKKRSLYIIKDLYNFDKVDFNK